MTRTELLKTAKPILFNTEMVRAILDGRKTVTRRVLKNQDENAFDYEWNYKNDVKDDVDLICDRNGEIYALANKPPCHTGDILYIRETWERFDCCHCEGDSNGFCLKQPDEKEGCYMYRASDEIWGDAKWHPSIHMPKEAARIFLRVTDVRVERLQDCGNAQAKDEGFTCGSQFARLWDTTIKKSDLDRYGWAANPWVWVIEFERVEVQNEN